MSEAVIAFEQPFAKADYPTEGAVRAELRAREAADPNWRPVRTEVVDQGDHWLVRFFLPAPPGTGAETGQGADGPPAVIHPDAFALSDQAAAYMVGEEAFVAFRYQDVSDHATIGYGHHKGLSAAQIDARFPDGLTETEAFALFQRDAAEFAGVVRRAITVALAQNQVDALIQVAFGTGNVNSEKDAVNAGDHAAAARAIATQHNRTGGRFHAGLQRRFGEVAKLYSDGIYPSPRKSRDDLRVEGLRLIRDRFPDRLNHVGNAFGRPAAASQIRQAREAFFRMTGERL